MYAVRVFADCKCVVQNAYYTKHMKTTQKPCYWLEKSLYRAE